MGGGVVGAMDVTRVARGVECARVLGDGTMAKCGDVRGGVVASFVEVPGA